jgi:hypothetical protein
MGAFIAHKMIVDFLMSKKTHARTQRYVKSQTRNRPRSGSASRAVKGFAPEADPLLGQIFPPETRNLFTPLLGHLSLTVLKADPLLGR